VESLLLSIDKAIRSGTHVTLPEVRDALQRAASLLCSRNAPHTAISRHLVSLPFQIFTKESINIGVSLWLGVIHENPKLEPRILFEVVEEWESTILRRQGLFDPSFK
jgi:phosphatidylinositol 4-kinase